MVEGSVACIYACVCIDTCIIHIQVVNSCVHGKMSMNRRRKPFAASHLSLAKAETLVSLKDGWISL